MNTYCFGIYHILSETDWQALSNISLIVQIHPTIHEIIPNKAFKVANGLISQLFVVTFVYPTYMQIALIWGFTVQLSLWKSVHWLWRYKLNEVCERKESNVKNCQSRLSHFCIFFSYFFFSCFLHSLVSSFFFYELSQESIIVRTTKDGLGSIFTFNFYSLILE